MANKSKHAFGALEQIDNALSTNIIDAFDILFVKDSNGKPYVGWIDKDGNKVVIEDKTQVVRVNELPTTNGDENVVYVYNNAGYIWDADNSQCVPLAKSEDLTALETQVTNLTTEMTTKVDKTTVQNMIDDASASEVVEF